MSAQRVEKIRPQPGPQMAFLSSPADIVIYGGSAGGGKTFGLLIDPLRHLKNPGFGAVIFRKTYRQIEMEGGMWDEASKIYTPIGAIPVRHRMEYTWKTGAKVSFAHMQSEADRINYDGAQIPQISFDQLEHFNSKQFWYMLSRNRSVCGVKPYIRATCNPSPDSWLYRIISWWIDDNTGYAIGERSGAIRWFIKSGDDLIWADTRQELLNAYPGSEPKSLTFIRSSVYDNKILMSKDPGYLSNLMALDHVERERLLNGNWKIKPAAGKLYNRAWYELKNEAPNGGTLCRYFDFAATAKTTQKSDPDYTAGALIRLNGPYYLEDVVSWRLSPIETDARFFAIVSQDIALAKRTGARYMLRWEEEGGASGPRDSSRLMQELSKRFAGLDCRGVRNHADKIVRGKAFGAQSEAGNVYVLDRPWTDEWLNHMHNQPELPHDDICDATTGAFNNLTTGGWARGPSR